MEQYGIRGQTGCHHHAEMAALRFPRQREAWSDIRRTGYPSGLVFPEVSGTIPNVPNRWRYPNTEVNYNPYYKEVSAEDTYYHKLFWQNKDFVRKPILPEEYIILTTE